MTEAEKRPMGLLHAADELRRVILENPELPLLVFAGEDAVCDYSRWTGCSWMRVTVGEFLDCQQEVDEERVYTDRDNFAEDFVDDLYDERVTWSGTDEEWEKYEAERLAEYKPYWKPCIILMVDN